MAFLESGAMNTPHPQFAPAQQPERNRQGVDSIKTVALIPKTLAMRSNIERRTSLEPASRLW